MKVKTTITFEVVYPLDLEFYGTDKKKALEMEKTYAATSPMEMIEAYEARGEGTFTTSVEVVDLEPGRVPIIAKVNKTWIDGTYTIKSTGTTEV